MPSDRHYAYNTNNKLQYSENGRLVNRERNLKANFLYLLKAYILN